MSDEVAASGTNVRGGDASEAHRSYRALANVVDAGAYQLDPEGRFVAVDDAFLDLTGYPREDLVGEDLSVLLDDDDRDRLEAAIDERLSAGGEAVDAVEVALETAGGGSAAAEFRASLIFDDGFEGTVGVVREASGRQRDTEAAEAAFDETVTSVLDEADVGVFVLDDGFDVTWVDATAAEYFGLDRAAVIGRDKRELLEGPITERIIDGDAFAETLLSAYEEGGYPDRLKCRVSGDAGGERRLEHRSQPVESGRYAGGRVELYHDVTGHHRHVSRLRQLHEAVSEWLEHSSRAAVAERASRHLRDVLDMEVNGIFLYDPETGRLEPTGWSERAEALFGELPAFGPGQGIAWRVFESGRPEIYDDVTDASDVYDPATPARSEMILPIGDHGVVIVGAEQKGVFDDDDVMLAKVVASNLEATFDRVRHERRLERERDRTDRILDAIPVGTVVLDADGAVTRINDRAVELFAVQDRESFSLADRPVYDETGGRLAPEEQPFGRTLETGEPVYDRVLQVERSDGDRRWLSVNAVPLFDDDGDVDRVVTTSEDVTGLKERERTLETELDEVFGRVSDAFYALDEEWRFTYLNEQAEQLLGFDESELRGKRFADVYPESAGLERILDRFRQAMETQEPVNPEYYSELLEVWVEATVYPSETGVSVYFRDVTERKQRERELEESERRYRTLVENFPNGAVALVDRDLTYRTVGGSPGATAGVTVDEVEGQPVAEAVPPDLAEELVPRYEAALEGESSAFEFERADGTYRFQIVPVRDEDGEVFAALGMSQDVTERKEIQRELEASNERLEQFAYAASHDLKEPLRMVSSYLQLLERRYGDELDEDGTEFLAFAVDGAERMQEMIDALLEYARVETRGDPFEPVDLEDVLDDVLDDLQVKVEESDAEITAEDLPCVEGDASQLRQLFQNLLDNAVEYSGDEPPRVHVAAERRGSEWAVSVADEGIGIDPEATDRIFEVFQRLDAADDHAGTGIGLALCRRIVERHGGDITVESTPGEGATFTFTLPAEDGR
jgi:PAS domain S-box-containing protein